MDAQSTPAVSLDTCIHIIGSVPLSNSHRLAILTGHAGQSPMFISFSAVNATIGGVNKAIGQFGSFKGHVGVSGCSNQGHDYRWPGERGPSAMLRWFCKIGA